MFINPKRLAPFALCSYCAALVTSGAVRAQGSEPALIFPVSGGADWQDSFGAARSGHSHQGQDLMAPKMRPLVACFDGVVRVLPQTGGSAGNRIVLTGTGSASGWYAEYMHLNNDTPGAPDSDDGQGGPPHAFAPGLKTGDLVRAGQFIGWVGDSGNAENAGSHCHFELHGPNGVVNPVYALRAARILPAPSIGAIPNSSPPLQMEGTILAVFPGQAEAVMKVVRITGAEGKTLTLSPPRAKPLILRKLREIPNLAVGDAVTVSGRDLGRGRPLAVTKVSAGGVEVEEAAPDTLNAPRVSTSPAPHALPLLPDRILLDGFESGVYQGWRLDGAAFGNTPRYLTQRTRKVNGWRGSRFLSTSTPRPGDRRIDSGTGVAVSPEFAVTHTRLRFLIGGGNFPRECFINLVVDGQTVQTATGPGSDIFQPVEWDISAYVGKRARFEIVDKRTASPFGYLLIDELELAVLPPAAPEIPEVADPTAPSEAAPDALPLVPAKTKRGKTPTQALAAPPLTTITLPDGTRVEGRRLLTLEATGYGPEDNGQWGDRTALGTQVGYGTVAVDPRVIPLRSRLWVEGYGFCIALDVGSAIKGSRIDLGQDNQDDALRVGRRKVRVLLLK